MRVTYYGQACTLIEAAGIRILTDPWLTEGAYFGTWFHTHLLADAGVSPQVVARRGVDYLFISHEHQDHLDPATIRHLPHDVPVLICKFPTSKFRERLEALGLTNIREVASGEAVELDRDVKVTIFGTAEYTNDSALLVEAEGFTVFNETDCKLGYDDLKRLAARGIDIGFYMFSGANWYPIMYDYPEPEMLDRVRARRRALVQSFVQRVKLTKPKLAVPAAGPCTVLDPERLWLNSPERGIFIDPAEAVAAVGAAAPSSQGVCLAATDVWDSASGVQFNAPAAFRGPREDYIRDASARMKAAIVAQREAEAPAGSDLSHRITAYFEEAAGALSPEMRRRIGAKLGLAVTGPQGGSWTVDFQSASAPYVQDGLAPDWTYKIELEDKLIYPFLAGCDPFFEDVLLSLRARCARRPDIYNEPLYHFLYEPNPTKLENWYATH